MRRSLRSLAHRLSSATGRPALEALGSQQAACTSLLGPLDSAAPAALGSLCTRRRLGPCPAVRQLASGTTCSSAAKLYPPADQLPVEPLPEAVTACILENPSDEALGQAEEGLGESGDSDFPLPPLPGPGSEFLYSDRLGSLPLGEGLQRSADFHGQQWQFETGKMARLADGSCTLRAGNTTVLATAVCSTNFVGRREPLNLVFSVDYRERSFAVGRIPTGYNKREGAAKEHEILAGRSVDRALRPLFPKGFAFDVQVTTSVLSADGSQDLDVAAINAASAALLCSDIPWAGPVAAVRVTLDAAGGLHINLPLDQVPQQQQQGQQGQQGKQMGGEGPRLRLLVAATKDRVVMLEAEGAEVPEQEFARALRIGAAEARKLLQPQLDLAATAGRAKRSVQLAGADPAALSKVAELATERIEGILRNSDLDKTSRARALQKAKADVLQQLREEGSFRYDSARTPGSGCVSPQDMEHSFTALVLRTLRRLAVEEGLRADGRGLIDCRQLHCEIDTVPVVHGSALFTRGETQSLCTATVGGRGDEQKTESLLEGEGAKRLAVHYAFPAFSINEVSVNSQRRETGHSRLAEKALLPVLPPEATFPFPLRLNADTLASNGSSSLAAVCGGSLALWDAGVPLKSLVAGVSVGLMAEQCWDGMAKGPEQQQHQQQQGEDAGRQASAPFGRYELLTDLMGLEDQLGDMDFKIAGSKAGITACQLDVKVAGGVPEGVLIEALERARLARSSILQHMEAVVQGGRPSTAPQFGVVSVQPHMLGRLIGPSGSNIKSICEETGARVDIAQDDGGDVRIYAPSAQQFERAKQRVLQSVGGDIQEGEKYTVKVTRLADFGAFVEFPTGARTLLHISEVAPTKIRSIDDVVSVGDSVEVLCLGRDARGNIKISRKALLANQ